MGMERYQRQKLLGQGPMSMVWLARESSTQELVALKIMLAITEDDQRNQKAYERFHREIEIARSLRHAHVLPIIDSGYTQYQGRSVPFLVSPYIQEGSLADLIKKNPPWEQWSLAQTADTLLQAAESLWYLHTHTPQIVHQDVKPGNFLFKTMGCSQRAIHLYLCDFGISRWLQSSTTLASELLGTFVFMAPEQVERKVDCASDQYALAVMSCYLLTGKLPIQAQTNELYVRAHLHDLPLPPSSLNPTRLNSPEVDAVILRALEKHPKRRYPTIMHFAQELQRAVMNFSQVETPVRAEKLVLAENGRVDGRRTAFVPQQARDPIVIDLSNTDDGRILDEPLPAKPPKAVVSATKHGEVVFPLLPLHGLVRHFLPARPKTLCWSHDGNYLACVLYGYAPLLLHKDGSSQEVLTANATHTVCVCWSPDDRFLAISSQGEIRFWDTVLQAPLPLVLPWNVSSIDGLDWSANGQLAVWANHQIVIYALSHGQLTASQVLPLHTIPVGVMRCGNVGVLCWSPDGSRLAAGASNGSVVCWNTKDVNEMNRQTSAWQIAAAGQKVNGLAWSPNNSLLAVAFRDKRVVGWDTNTRSEMFRWEGLPTMPRMLSISTEQRIVMASSERRILFGCPDEPCPTTMFPGQLLAAWSPTCLELATLDEQKETTLTVWRELSEE